MKEGTFFIVGNQGESNDDQFYCQLGQISHTSKQGLHNPFQQRSL